MASSVYPSAAFRTRCILPVTPRAVSRLQPGPTAKEPPLRFRSNCRWIWTGASTIRPGSKLRSPWDSFRKIRRRVKPPRKGTEFRVLYTATTLYVGVICYDAGADGILATERRRDNNLGNDDTITLVLDTFHDHRNAFLFRTNPLGTQYDAMITDEGNDVNENWDEKWDVASQVSPAGWTAEFAIPFKSLRVSERRRARLGIRPGTGHSAEE